VARPLINYQESVGLVTGDMTYEAWRAALQENNVDVATTIQQARQSGDVVFYNVRDPETGRLVPHVAPRGTTPPARTPKEINNA
jgi:hypothetical protein